jgi:hypothetical protein
MQWKRPSGVKSPSAARTWRWGVEDEVVAEGVYGGDGSEFAIGEIEAGAEDFLEGVGGRFE